MARIKDELTFDSLRDEILAHLCLPGSNRDPMLSLITETALDCADTYLGDVLDPTTDLDFETFPTSIRFGLLELIRVMWSETGPRARKLGLSSAKTGDESETYSFGGAGGAVFTLKQAMMVARPYWFTYRENPCA